MNQEYNKVISISFGTILKTIVALAVVYFLYILKDIVLIVLTAVVIASAIEPLTRWFTTRGVPRTIAVIIIYLAVFAILVGIVYLFVPTFIAELSSLLQNIPSQVGSVQISDLFKDSQFLHDLPLGEGASISEYITQLQATLVDYSEGLFRTVASIFGGVVSFVLVVVISFYLAVKENGIEEFIKIVTPYSHQDYAVGLWKRTQSKIGKWLQGQLLLMFIIGALTYVGLKLLGVPNALLFSILAGFFEIIPIFGPILSAIPAIAVAYVDVGLALALMTAGLYIVVQQLENQLIYPQVVHKVVGVPALVVLLALLIGAKLAGFIGIILSVPIAALIMEFAYDIEKKNKELAQKDKKVIK